MEQKRKIFSALCHTVLILFSLTILSGCLGSAGSALEDALTDSRSPSQESPAPSSTSAPSQIVTTMPLAVIGNAVIASNDEAPVIRNYFNEPIRLDKESEEAPIHFEGQNEE